MQSNPQRLAWTVLIVAFALFLMLAVALPFGTRTLLVNSTRRQHANIVLAAGSVYVTRPSVGVPEALFGAMENLSPGARFETENASRAALSFAPPDNHSTLGTVQLYGDTEATLLELNTPRFQFSKRPHRIAVMLSRGRLRASVALGVERPVAMIVHTPQAKITLERPGSYSVEVRANEALVSVRTGVATVSAQGKSTLLTRDERTTVSRGSAPAGVLRGERNLIENGSFSAPLTNGWTTFQNRQDADESAGEVEVKVQQGRAALHFNRRGMSWAEVGIRQELGLDVRDYQELRLHLATWLAFQNLRNCGSLGSECPLMVRLEYQDAAGNGHEWLQGFFYLGSDSGSIPTRCVTCGTPTGNHLEIPLGRWHLYDSPNLMSLFGDTGSPPAIINAISFYASGHNFESYLTEVELQAVE